MTFRSRQRGYLLVTMIVTMFLVAAVAALLALDSSFSANTANRELESARADYVAQAGMQHALWRVQNNSCMGEFTIPATALGGDTYTATVSGAAPADMFVFPADQDAWIRSDDPDKNNDSVRNHVRFETGNTEQILTRFDVSALPANAQINSAIAWFHLELDKAHPEGSVAVYEITSDWGETTVTWDSFGGAYRKGAIGMIPAQDTGDVWVAVNVTGQVQAWVNGQPNNGVLFESRAEGVHAEYTSREDGANPPRLEVVVGSGPTSPVSIGVTGTLDTGVSRTLTQIATTAYQPGSSTMLQPGADDGNDAWTTAAKTAWNYGAHGTLRVQPNNQRTFLRMDLQSHVPVGARVTKATLELWATQVNASDAIDVHRVARPWKEGSCFGNCGPDDGITWDTYDGANAWATPGGDIDAVPASSATPSVIDTWVSWDITALAAAWAIDPSANYGVLLRGNAGSAVFASSDDPNPLLHPRMTIEYACECGIPCMAPRGTGRIALIGDDVSPDPDDQQKIAIIESWGYDVDFFEDQNSDSINWSDYDLAYVSETSISSDISANLTGLSIGVINEEPNLYADLLLAGGSTENVGSSLDIVDTNHFITSVFRPGSLSIYAADMEILTANTPLASGLQTLGTFNGAASLTATEKGAQTTSGTAAGRRVTLPFGQHSAAGFDWSYLDPNGLLLVQRAIAWAMTTDTVSAGNLLLVVGDATGLTSKDLDRMTLFQSWGYTVTLIDDGADQGTFDTEAAANDVIYVTASISGGTLADKLTNSATPIVNEFAGKLDSFGFSSNTGNTVTANLFTATNAAHYISDPFGGAGVTQFTSNITMPVASGTLAPGLQSAAELGTLTWALPTLEKGAERWDGNPAAARRVHLPFGAADTNQLTADGQTLMKRSLEWAAAPVWLGPTAHWELDETSGNTAVDSAGGHDGTLTNGPNWTAGVVAGGLDFDGTDDYVDLTSDAELDDVFAGGATVTAWIYPRGWGENGYGRVFDKSSSASSTGDGWLIRMNKDNSGTLNFGQGFSGGRGWWKAPNGAITLNTWQHIALSYDSNSTSNDPLIYLNGSPVTVVRVDSPGGSANSDAAINLRLGNFAGGTAHTFDGVIDDARIYDRVLSAEEIAELAEQPPRLLLVVGDPGSLSIHDRDRRDRIEEWGYSVTLIDDNASAADFDAAVSSSDVIYVRSTVSWSAIGDKLDDADKGLVNEVVNLIDDFGFASSFSFYDSTGFSSTNASHSITSSYAGAAVTTFSITNRMYVPDGTLSPDLVSVGSSNGGPPGDPGLTTLESGASMYGGGSAPARRVHLPMSGITTTDMTADGREIMRRAIDWAAGTGGSGGGGGGGGGVQYIEVNELFWPGTADSWETVDLGTYGVPANAVVEIGVMNNDGGRENWVGARAVASGLERRFRLHEAEGGGYDTTVMHVQADANSRIQTYADRTNSIAFKLLGYWTSASYVERFDCFAASGSNSWREHDFSNQGVGPNQVAEVAVVNTSTSQERLAGVRPSGSSMQRRFNIHEAESGGVDTVSMMIETDGSAIAEVYASSNSDIEFCVVGFWSTPPGTYTEHGGAHSQMTQAANWQSWNLASYGVPANSVVQVVMTNDGDTAEQEMGVRSMGSAQSRLLELQEAESGGSDNASMHVVVDGNARIEAYSESGPNDRYFYPVGWWVLN